MAFWITAFCLGIFLFTAGLFCFFRRRHSSSAYGILLSFLAGWILGCPYEYYVDIPFSAPGLHLAESIFTALLNTFTVYMGNGYERYFIEGHPVFTAVYSLTSVLIDIVFMFFVLGFILSLLDGPSQQLRFLYRNRRKAYIFSAANEKSLLLAQSLPAGKHSLIFCLPQLPPENIKRNILQLDAVYLTRSVRDIILSRRNSRADTEIFLFGDNETENLQSLDTVCSLDFRRIRTSVRVYAEISDTPWNCFAAPPAADNLTVNLIRTEESFAYDLLLKHSIFEDAVPAPQNREIKVLLAGMSRKSRELLKTILFLGQMPGYFLKIMVLDSASGRSALQQSIPELTDECRTDGDALYSLLYKENISFTGCDPETLVKNSFSDFTWAYVDIGNDTENLLLARRLYTLKQRMGISAPFRIYVNTSGNRNGCIALPEEIIPAGILSELYCYPSLTMSAIERASREIHKIRQREKAAENPDYTIQSWQAYCSDEYKRHSVYARTLSYKFKTEILDRFYDGRYDLAAADPLWKKYEHMRWNMYTRVTGYIKPDAALSGKITSAIRSSALVHPDLLPYSELSPEDQAKDAMKITPEIASILKTL